MTQINTSALHSDIDEAPRNAALRSAKSVVGALQSSRPPQQMAMSQFNGLAFGNSRRPSARTVTSLKRWSVAGKELPDIAQIKTIHVYDFDNTLFQSPLPNPQLWVGSTISFLQTYEGFAGGGWWHDPNVLLATGEGADVEETRAWQGWWNDKVVELVELSMKQKDALTVLLTGRGEANFTDIIKRIVTSRKLEFDLICLKPEVGPNGQQFSTTLSFKQSFFEDLISTYAQADEIRVYEDRIKHVKQFREHLERLNRIYSEMPNSRKPITAEVIHVSETTRYLDPVTEVAEVQKLINAHNGRFHDPAQNSTGSRFGRLKIKRAILYTAYLINNTDSSRLISDLLCPELPPGIAESGDIKFLANTIMIAPRPASSSVLNKVGGVGKKLKWQVTGIGHWDNRLWAARVQPVPSDANYYTENQSPSIVLGHARGARLNDSNRIQKWKPVPAEKAFVLETTVGERAILRVEEENQEGDWESPFANKNNKRRRPQGRQDDDTVPYNRDGLGNNRYTPLSDNPFYTRTHPSSGRGRGRGGRSGPGRGRGQSSRGRGRGRGTSGGGGPGGYRSLDDQQMDIDSGYENGGHGNSGGGVPPMNY